MDRIHNVFIMLPWGRGWAILQGVLDYPDFHAWRAFKHRTTKNIYLLTQDKAFYYLLCRESRKHSLSWSLWRHLAWVRCHWRRFLRGHRSSKRCEQDRRRDRVLQFRQKCKMHTAYGPATAGCDFRPVLSRPRSFCWHFLLRLLLCCWPQQLQQRWLLAPSPGLLPQRTGNQSNWPRSHR